MKIGSTSPSEEARTLMKSTETKLFYSLYKTPKHIKPGAGSYWQYLTLDSYYVYENIFKDCKPIDGKVTCE